jgi:hypothetical protein
MEEGTSSRLQNYLKKIQLPFRDQGATQVSALLNVVSYWQP